jgi:GxxExxY protein
MYQNTELTKKIIELFYKVYNTLGYGFLEKVYQNSLFYELQKAGLKCVKQQHIKVFYSNIEVGEYFADIIVEDKIILELKAAESLCEEHEYQLLNYLKATEIEVGLLLNFGKKPELKRKYFSNTNKKIRENHAKSELSEFKLKQ